MRSSGVRRVAPAPIKAISYYSSSHTPRELQAAAARGLDCFWEAGSKCGALCKNREMRRRVPSTSRKTRFASKPYMGIRYAETQTPGMLRKPRDSPYVCPRPKKFKRLAARDTLNGSRPNLRQREPDGRILPTLPTFGTKVRARRDVPEGKNKITIIHIC